MATARRTGRRGVVRSRPRTRRRRSRRSASRRWDARTRRGRSPAARGARSAFDVEPRSSASAIAGSPNTHGPHWPALSRREVARDAGGLSDPAASCGRTTIVRAPSDAPSGASAALVSGRSRASCARTHVPKYPPMSSACGSAVRPPKRWSTSRIGVPSSTSTTPGCFTAPCTVTSTVPGSSSTSRCRGTSVRRSGRRARDWQASRRSARASAARRSPSRNGTVDRRPRVAAVEPVDERALLARDEPVRSRLEVDLERRDRRRSASACSRLRLHAGVCAADGEDHLACADERRAATNAPSTTRCGLRRRAAPCPSSSPARLRCRSRRRRRCRHARRSRASPRSGKPAPPRPREPARLDLARAAPLRSRGSSRARGKRTVIVRLPQQACAARARARRPRTLLTRRALQVLRVRPAKRRGETPAASSPRRAPRHASAVTLEPAQWRSVPMPTLCTKATGHDA